MLVEPEAEADAVLDLAVPMGAAATTGPQLTSTS